MGDKAKSIKEILEDELEKRSFVTDLKLLPEELFEGPRAAAWMKKLLGAEEGSELDRRIEDASPERLSHAIAAYLFGIAVKEGLGLNFDSLPRMFSYGAAGDAFYFFWSVICLCHDLGYGYETGENLDRMDEHEDRCGLLGIEYDLFELKEEDLCEYGIKGSEEKWVSHVLALAKKYDEMRRRTKDDIKEYAVIDHGIAGALLLYDILMKQYERAKADAKKAAPADARRNPAAGGTAKAQAGEISANAACGRFAACSILIACTVARHNMWNASDEESMERYRNYELETLCGEREDAVVSAETEELNQMLFMLDYMDTIDPIKAIYTRWAEEHADGTCPQREELAQRLDFLLNSVRVEFMDDYRSQYRWGKALRYRKFVISIQEPGNEGLKADISKYAKNVKRIKEWMATKTPVSAYAEDGLRIACYYPTYPQKEREWLGGIKDHEIAALCLYEGCGGSPKAGPFYQNHHAYQTFNLLMMRGLEGESVRICEEGQRPEGLYIREWEKTLEVMTDIFTAQCKYMKFCEEHPENETSENKTSGPVVYRADRMVNYNMMKDMGRTYAFMSTSKAGFLKDIANPKKGLVLLEIDVRGRVPYIDYEKVLGDSYVYLNEKEVLFPPFLKFLEEKPCALEEDEQEEFCAGKEDEVHKYRIYFSGFEIRDGKDSSENAGKAGGEMDGSESAGKVDDEMELIRRLDEKKETAAQILDEMRERRAVRLEEDRLRCYCGWKADFQSLVNHCFYNISKTYGLHGSSIGSNGKAAHE